MPPAAKSQARAEGTIETLPSGSLRVKVYSGRDPLTKRAIHLTEVVKPGPRQAREAETVRRRLLGERDARRHPVTTATIDTLMSRVFDDGPPPEGISASTLVMYKSKIKNHIKPVIGHLTVATFAEPEIIGSFTAELKRCDTHCDRHPRTDHRTPRTHECDARCKPHRCKPLGASAIRSTFAVLSVAYAKAERWKWITHNPITEVELPSLPAARPVPPAAAQAARILDEAWRDPSWGLLIWLKVRTGARRGELCALLLTDIEIGESDHDPVTVGIDKAVAKTEDGWVEHSTKPHQHRRIALDPAVDGPIIRAYVRRLHREAAERETPLAPRARFFSPSPDHGTFLTPDSVSRRYSKMCGRIGLDTSIKRLRVFNATELIAAGVTGPRLPAPPEWIERLEGTEDRPAVPEEPSEQYEKIAADLAGAIRAGLLPSGAELPSMKTLAERYRVAVSTVHRAIDLLKRDGLAKAGRGVRASVT